MVIARLVRSARWAGVIPEHKALGGSWCLRSKLASLLAAVVHPKPKRPVKIGHRPYNQEVGTLASVPRSDESMGVSKGCFRGQQDRRSKAFLSISIRRFVSIDRHEG